MVMVEKDIVSSLLKGATKVMHTEGIILESIQDLIKDEIKTYIRNKLDEDKALKKELKEAVSNLIDAKIKEGIAIVKIAKCGAKLGLNLVPANKRDELMKELIGMFEKEINALIEKTI